MDLWEDAGVVKKFAAGSVVEIVAEKEQTSTTSSTTRKPLIRPINSQHMYYCTAGMGSIPLSIRSENSFKIHQDVWISPGNGVKYIGTSETNPQGQGQWSVQTNGKRFGTYDHVIIAHNGKCADRLMSKTPAKDLHSLLVVDFRPTVPEWGGKKMTLNSIYSLTVALQKNNKNNNIHDVSHVVGKEVVTAFVKNAPELSLITNQSRKFANAHAYANDDLEVWTILSSAKFAKKYKGPQENLPQERVEEVTRLMLSSLEKSLGLAEGTIHDGLVKDSRLQLWGAGVPLNVWSSSSTGASAAGGRAGVDGGFLYDADHGVGVCGDWLLDPSIAGAWESGRRLANWMVEGTQMQHQQRSVGLPPDGGKFKVSRAASGSGIGNVR